MAKFLNSTMAMIPIIVNPAIALSTYPSKKKKLNRSQINQKLSRTCMFNGQKSKC